MPDATALQSDRLRKGEHNGSMRSKLNEMVGSISELHERA